MKQQCWGKQFSNIVLHHRMKINSFANATAIAPENSEFALLYNFVFVHNLFAQDLDVLYSFFKVNLLGYLVNLVDTLWSETKCNIYSLEMVKANMNYIKLIKLNQTCNYNVVQ